MEESTLNTYSDCFKQAVQEISNEVLEMELDELKTINIKVDNNGKKFDVVVGMTGDYKGRFLLETTEESARTITEIMNFGPLDEENELYLFMGEFANMLSGRALTYLNNLDSNKIIRLTPPAIFTGVDLEITTPNIEYTNMYYGKDDIQMKLDIGFEGV